MFRLKGPAMLQKNYTPAFPLKHQQKDMRLALALGDENAVSMPVAAAANEVCTVLMNNFFTFFFLFIWLFDPLMSIVGSDWGLLSQIHFLHKHRFKLKLETSVQVANTAFKWTSSCGSLFLSMPKKD